MNGVEMNKAMKTGLAVVALCVTMSADCIANKKQEGCQLSIKETDT